MYLFDFCVFLILEMVNYIEDIIVCFFCIYFKKMWYCIIFLMYIGNKYGLVGRLN